ncbi:MAG: hypothetical protein PWQ17_1002 [Anaerophaga sp.]|nr:hypothetical protein [Anaerophaga sp.]
MILPVLFATGIPFFVIHGTEPFLHWSVNGLLLFLLMVVVGVPLHELLHALVFGAFARGGYKTVKFGIDKSTYTPYCHCTAPMRVQYYRVGALLPLIVLGVVPFVISLITGSFGFWFYGFIYIIAAGGDLVALNMLKKIPAHRKVLDHPQKMGFYVLD